MSDNNNIFAMIFSESKKMKQFPVITDVPDKRTWYRVPLDGCICGNGEPYYVSVKIGTDKGLIVNFNGGGVSISKYMAARPMVPENTTDNGFYFNRVEPISDPAVDKGILSNDKNNYFRDWTVICLNYSSGDFHIGTADYEYTAMDGSRKILYHHGYTNFKAAMDKLVSYIPMPDKLLICGESAGGFAAHALADDIIRMFPQCTNITVCSDGAHLCYERWQNVAVKLWKAPKHITDYLTERNYTLGCMLGLFKKYGECVKYLYTTSTRDAALGDFQQKFDNKQRGFTKRGGDLAETYLLDMYKVLVEKIRSCGVYIYDDIPYPNVPEEYELTLHTILLTDFLWSHRIENVSAMEWLINAVNGQVQKIVCKGFMEMASESAEAGG